VIKTVIFDLGKVVIPFDLQRGYAALQPHCAIPVEDIPRRISATDLVMRFEQGQVTSEQFVAELSSILGLNGMDYARFCGLWSSIFLPDPIVPESLLEGLRRRYRLLLLSNTNAIHFEMIRQTYPLIRHFHDYVLSYEVGALKPAPRIYEEAIARAGCRPDECFFTDDIPQYVEAARRAGIDAVVFRSVAQLEDELRARGVEWE
jgi:putative hydrolase of the HAD superfamily